MAKGNNKKGRAKEVVEPVEYASDFFPAYIPTAFQVAGDALEGAFKRYHEEIMGKLVDHAIENGGADVTLTGLPPTLRKQVDETLRIVIGVYMQQTKERGYVLAPKK